MKMDLTFFVVLNAEILMLEQYKEYTIELAEENKSNSCLNVSGINNGTHPRLVK